MATNIMKQLSNQLVELSDKVQERLVHIGGEGIPYRTGVWFDKTTIVTTAVSAKEGEVVPVLEKNGNILNTRVQAFHSQSEIVILKADEERSIPEWKYEEPHLGALAITIAFPSPAGAEARLELIRIAQEDYFQTDGVGYPGFSGAITISPEGKLLGIVNSNASGNDGQAIPARQLKSIVEQLQTTGSTKKRVIGVRTQQIVNGLLVVEVISGGAAEKANILVGDILVKLNDRELMSNFELLSGLEKSKDDIELSIIRGGKEIKVIVTPDETEENYSRRWKHHRQYKGHGYCCP
jgi:S1-C subfamily serine protease